VQAHHLQVSRDQFLALVEQRMDLLERRQRRATNKSGAENS